MNGVRRSGFEFIASPNFNERKAGTALQYIVLHYTGMNTAEEWLAAVCDPKTKLSAHYLVDDNGRAVQLVGESERAWHAGKSFWRGIVDMNSASIGIELQNPGHERGYSSFPAAQIDALKKLVRGIIKRHDLDAARCLVAHSDIAPTRKIDPGELFPWRELATGGLGFWPESLSSDAVAFDRDQALVLLEAVGYDVSTDEARQASLAAFQRRFHPEMLGKIPDGVTMVRLHAVADFFSQPSE